MIDSDETNVPGDLSIADVQKRLSISRAQVYNLVNTGRLAAYRIGRRGLRVRHESVMALRDNLHRRGAA
jgi:excisionase family DNA binding protein